MTRRASQILALIVLSVLVTVAVWYQSTQDSRLQSSVLNNTGYLSGTGYPGTVGYPNATGTTTSSTSPESLAANSPNFSTQQGSLMVLKYLVQFDDLVVMDGLQVTTHVPSFSTPVLWEPSSTSDIQVVVDDERSTRTAFLAPQEEGEVHFDLRVENASGDYQTVARYEFLVLSPIAYTADVNKDGKYDFQNDLVNLLRNWNSFGEDATRTLALILSRLEDDDTSTSTP